MTAYSNDMPFRAIFDTMFQFIGLMQTDGTLLEANQTALNFGGLTPADVIGKPFWECHWWTISSETQATVKAAIQSAARGEFIRYEVDVLGTAGRVATIDFSIKPVCADSGEVLFLIPEGRDITAHKQATMLLEDAYEAAQLSRDRLRGIIDGTTDLIAAIDLELRFITFNKGYAAEFQRIFWNADPGGHARSGCPGSPAGGADHCTQYLGTGTPRRSVHDHPRFLSGTRAADFL